MILSEREMRQINKKLPRPSNRVRGGFDFLDISVNHNCQIEIDPSLQMCVYIDDQCFKFGPDTSNDITQSHLGALDNFPNDTIHIGEGVFPKAIKNHISSPWSMPIWGTDYPKTVPTLESRSGWCCVMTSSEPHRDAIINNIPKSWFEYKNYFVYDDILDSHADLIPYMMRPPRPGESNKIRYNFFIGKKQSNTWPAGLHMKWNRECLIEVVGETQNTMFHITEKAIKPIAGGMPFVVAGCKGFMRRLQHFGFKTFHPFIDESYDTEDNLQTRVQMAVQSASDFLSSSDQQLAQLQEICDHNRKILHKIHTTSSFNDRIWRKIANKIKGLPRLADSTNMV